MRDLDGREVPRRRWWILPALVLGSLIAFLGWFDRSAAESVELGTPSRIIVVSDAGPVRLSTGPTSTVTHRDSWVVSQPKFEISIDGAAVLIRVVCDTKMPCRSSIDLQVTGTPDVLIVAEGFVDVDRFEGKLSILSSKDGVALGPISGSVRVVSTESVVGYGLRTDLLDISANNDVYLSFGDRYVPHRIQVLDTDGDVRPTEDDDVTIGVQSDGEADRSIAIRAGGEVSLLSFEQAQETDNKEADLQEADSQETDS